MNRDTEKIMKMLKVCAEVAIKIYNNMSIDLSECTERQFKKEVYVTYDVLKNRGEI